MKYILERTAAFADENALKAGIDGMTITVEGTAFRLIKMLPFINKMIGVAKEDFRPQLYLEVDFKIQAVSAGWTVQVITDQGQVAKKNFVSATVATFTRGTMYAVDATFADALQVVPLTPNMIVQSKSGSGESIIVSAATIPFYAFETSNPQGALNVTCIQCDLVPAMLQANNNSKAVANAVKAGSAMNNVQR